MTMRETDPVDLQYILSALETLERYDDISIQRLSEIYTTIADWASTRSINISDPSVLLSEDWEL